MANDESILREVDQELAEDQQWQWFRKNGPVLIGAAVAIVLGVAGWQIYSAQKENAAKQQALEYQNALELLAQDPTEGRTALDAVASEGGAYDDLARLQEAASYARGGERLKAKQVYQSVYEKNGAPKRIREYARLKAAQLALADGRDDVIATLGDLNTADGPFAVYARELEGLAALGAEDYEIALTVFRGLVIDFAAPEALRSRAEEFAALAEAGKAGVNITGETRVDDLIDALASPIEVTEPESHEGHDHGDEADEGVEEIAESNAAPMAAEPEDAPQSVDDQTDDTEQ